jgi:hypothetical protein
MDMDDQSMSMADGLTSEEVSTSGERTVSGMMEMDD